ncbi:MAG: M20/M25/M40 family metallo-hydrolase [Clostridia bacterium]|nr:M20/M25/M40 family metallo-hydrolase [Clostridia bacterium]
MQKSKIALGALGAAALGNAVHAALYRPKKETLPALPQEDVNVDRYRAHLSRAIQIKTISNRDPDKVDWDAFKQLRDFFDEAYPLVAKHLTREIVPPSNLVYHWKGTRPDLDPIALLGHQDVVPVSAGTEGDWTHPPFDGVDDGEFIWGRGALDMKNHVVCVLEAVESLLEDGFTPERDVYLLFGDNEEIVANEFNGARDIMRYLRDRGVHLDCVLDEGGAMLPVHVPGVLNHKYLAGVGVAEKGFIDIEIAVNAKGGHSSQPPKHSAVGVLANVIRDLENHQFKASLNTNMKALITAVGKNCTYPVRLVTCNLPLLYPVLLQVAKMIPPAACMVRTTTGVTMTQGSPQSNVLPQRASITVNFRAMPGVTTEDIVNHIKKAVRNKHIEINVLNSKEASRFSPTDARAYKIIERLCRQIEPNAIVAPYLVMGGTDACNYEPICENIYRYAPFRAGAELLLCTHGTNERVPVSTLADALRFFKNYVRECSAE